MFSKLSLEETCSFCLFIYKKNKLFYKLLSLFFICFCFSTFFGTTDFSATIKMTFDRHLFLVVANKRLCRKKKFLISIANNIFEVSLQVEKKKSKSKKNLDIWIKFSLLLDKEWPASLVRQHCVYFTKKKERRKGEEEVEEEREEKDSFF